MASGPSIANQVPPFLDPANRSSVSPSRVDGQGLAGTDGQLVECGERDVVAPVVLQRHVLQERLLIHDRLAVC